MDQSLLRTLTHVGFSDKEAKVLLACFSLGYASAAEIAKTAELKRPIVYHTLENLSRRGYVSQVPGEGVKRYTATNPVKILQVTQEHANNLKFMIPVLQAMYNRSQTKPKIEFFEGKEAIQNLFQTFGTAKAAKYVSSYKQLRKLFGSKVDSWIESAKNGKTKTVTKQLLVDEKEGIEFADAVKSADVWKIRFLPKGSSLAMDLAIVDGVVAITSFDPIFVVVIYSQSLSDSLGLLFDLSWKQSK